MRKVHSIALKIKPPVYLSRPHCFFLLEESVGASAGRLVFLCQHNGEHPFGDSGIGRIW